MIPMIRVNLGPRSYDVAVTSGDPAGLGPFAAERCRGRFAFLVTDGNVRGHAQTAREALAATGFRTLVAEVVPGEPSKSLHRAGVLYDLLADQAADRQTLVVAVGGGVVGDLAGLVAATYNRGLPLLL